MESSNIRCHLRDDERSRKISETANCMQDLVDPDSFDPDLRKCSLFLISKQSNGQLWLDKSEAIDG